jgi:hypothetical protein
MFWYVRARYSTAAIVWLRVYLVNSTTSDWPTFSAAISPSTCTYYISTESYRKSHCQKHLMSNNNPLDSPWLILPWRTGASWGHDPERWRGTNWADLLFIPPLLLCCAYQPINQDFPCTQYWWNETLASTVCAAALGESYTFFPCVLGCYIFIFSMSIESVRRSTVHC